MAAKQGYGLPFAPPTPRALTEGSMLGEPPATLVPADWSSLQVQLRQRQQSGVFAACQYSLGMRPELALAAMALAGTDQDRPQSKDDANEPKLSAMIARLIAES